MEVNSGKKANWTGKNFENFVYDNLIRMGFQFIDNKEFERAMGINLFSQNNYIRFPDSSISQWFTTQFYLSDTIYGTKWKVDFLLHNVKRKKTCLTTQFAKLHTTTPRDTAARAHADGKGTHFICLPGSSAYGHCREHHTRYFCCEHHARRDASQDDPEHHRLHKLYTLEVLLDLVYKRLLRVANRGNPWFIQVSC